MVLIVGTVITSLVDVLIVKLRIENEFMWLIGSGYKNSLGKYDKDELGSLFLEVIIVDTLKVVSLVILSLVVGKII